MRKNSVDLRREIIEVGGTQYLFELRKKPKKKKEEKAPEPEPEEIVGEIPCWEGERDSGKALIQTEMDCGWIMATSDWSSIPVDVSLPPFHGAVSLRRLYYNLRDCINGHLEAPGQTCRVDNPKSREDGMKI